MTNTVMKNSLRVALAALCALTANAAFAWGASGHKAVGAIADQLIAGTPAAAHVKALLLPGETLESVSVWADNVKGSYNGSVVTQEMRDYAAANPQHAEYHYTDVPFQNRDYYEGEVGTTEHDVVHTLTQAIAVLQGNNDEKSNPHHFTPRQALLLLVHLSGDITQPLHVGSAYLDRNGKFAVPSNDGQIKASEFVDLHGGNSLLVEDKQPPASVTQPEQRGPRPLHSYWDSTVVDYAMKRVGAKTPAEFAQIAIAGKPSVARDHGAVGSWPLQWANDTLAVSKLAFAAVVPGAPQTTLGRNGLAHTSWLVSLPDDYAVPSSALASAQLVKGGYRLAALLEQIWK